MMRIVVVSDTHGYIDSFIDKINLIDKPDIIIHLGDYVRDAERISKKLGIKTIIVKGNGDIGSNYNEDELISIKGNKIFLTHGHKHNVNEGIDNLYYKGLELGANIILFGHTHIPIVIIDKDIIIMNPGSPTNPRANKRIPTFGLIDIGDIITNQIIQIN